MIIGLALKNFRCFQDFTLNGIRPVTLIAGKNNVGKSTLLESLFFFMDRNSSDVFLKLNSFRGIYQLNLSPRMVWEPLFTNMDANNALNISIITSNGESQTLAIIRDNSFSLSAVPGIPLPINAQGVGLPIPNSYPLKLSFNSAAYTDISHFTISDMGITLTPQKPIMSTAPYIHYFGSKMSASPQQVAEWFSQIELEGKKPQCVEVIQKLDLRVRDLSVATIGGISGVFADLNLSSRLSVNILGDGIYKLMQIALVMLANPGAIVLVDEIENGFHYSFFPKLWEIVRELVIKTKCQFFATTHSYECICGTVALAADKQNPDLFRFVRLDYYNNRITPKSFDSDSLEYAIKNDWEVR